MPRYGNTLSAADVRALIAYARAVSDPPYQPAGTVCARKQNRIPADPSNENSLDGKAPPLQRKPVFKSNYIDATALSFRIHMHVICSCQSWGEFTRLLPQLADGRQGSARVEQTIVFLFQLPVQCRDEECHE